MAKIQKYDHQTVDAKWQNSWEKQGLYAAKSGQKNYYLLVELAYSSGDLHIGHWFGWTAPDVLARFKRMNGYNVLFPVGGFDSFGLPAENAAIKHNVHPHDWTVKNIDTMRSQFRTMGPSFDWNKEVITSDPEYYRWTQWLFLQFYKHGLAYKKKVSSNWCPECKTVLANEHVEDGCCWRHTDTQVVQKKVDQWLLKITKYADELIWPDKPEVDWPKSMREGQNNWIGKKAGITISYPIQDTKMEIKTWTSRPDTNFGATFIVLAPEHPLALKITTKENRQSVSKYIKVTSAKTQRERLIEEKGKTGAFTGSYAINQLNGKKLPIYISDFVLGDVGTGAVVGVPGHDKRDFEFAAKFDLEVKRVVVASDGDKSKITSIDQVQEEEGTMINSDFLDGLDIHAATERMIDHLESKGWGKRETTYHLRDWSFSRQRYWGAPIPIVYCDKCGTVPVPESDLPVELPYEVDYTPTGKAPLATSPEFVNTSCPKCKGDAKRETETMDAYVDSAWYFMRYPNPKYQKGPFDPESIKNWLPIDVYFGGPEHILGHTLYARFVTKFLQDIGHINYSEFAKVRHNHGIILGPDGSRMSKSKGNVVNPDNEVQRHGADAVRLFLCFLGPHEKGGPWSKEGVEGTHRFLNRIWNLFTDNQNSAKRQVSRLADSQEALEGEKTRFQSDVVKTHQTIKKVSEDIEELKFNTAVASLMEYVNHLRTLSLRGNKVSKNSLITLCQLIAPFAPHLAEEAWSEVLGQKGSVHKSSWPKYDQKLAHDKEVTLGIQVEGKLRSTLTVPSDEAKAKDKLITKAAADPKVSKYLKDHQYTTIFIPGKIISFVIDK